MPTEHHHHSSGTLQAAAALATTAGFVDAFIYRRVSPVFVANMSGNLVRLGMSIGSSSHAAALWAVTALIGFAGGVATATALLDHRVRNGHAPSPQKILIAEALLLVMATVILMTTDTRYSGHLGPVGVVVIVVTSLSMGLQVIALRRVGQIAVSTTYGTGAVVRLTEKLILAARRATPISDVRRQRTVTVLSIVLVCYVAGAAIGTAVGPSPLLLLLPAAVPITQAIASRFAESHHEIDVTVLPSGDAAVSDARVDDDLRPLS